MGITITRRDFTQFCAATCGATILRSTACAQAPPLPAQTARPEFDVSTVKPTDPNSAGTTEGISTHAGVVDGRNVTVQRCIIGAYSVGPHQVVGGPDWVYTDRFDIMGKADRPINDDDILNQMLQRLLADRFKLTLHRASKVLPAYVLEVDKNGPKLEHAEGGDSYTDTSTGKRRRVTIDAKNTNMDLFAQVLARKVDLPVVNQTGLTGIFNFKLHWTPESVPVDQQTVDDISIFAALQEQLGLHLRSAKTPVEVLVIDHIERPTAN
jgi:uncharacterized protein (TIGR03435 family)